MEGWTFEGFTKKYLLSESTTNVLKSEELNELAALLSITENDIMALKIPTGQRISVRNAVANLKVEAQCGKKPVTTKDLQSSVKVDELAKLLSESGDMLQDVATPGVPPQAANSISVNSGKKPLLIPDFIVNSKVTVECEDDEVLDVSKGKLVFRSVRQKKPEEINMSQWTAANACICLKLIDSGELSDFQDVTKYMEHTRNIGELAQVNTVPSVMQYDHAFRKKQASGTVCWGDDDAHLARFYLERISSTTRFNNQPAQRQNRKNNVRRDIICREWQTLAGCSYGASCKYQHGVCIECHQQHPHYMHNSWNSSAPNSSYRGTLPQQSATFNSTGGDQTYGSGRGYIKH
jgi:hypothetical protein